MLLATLLACTGDSACPTSDTPTVTIGTGFNAFESHTDGDPVELIHGPQGGVHVTLALEATGFDTRDELTATFTGRVGGEQLAESTPFVFLRCNNATSTQQVWDLRVVYDADPATIDDQLSEVTVVLSDDDGSEATATTTLVIDDPTL